LDNHVDNLRIVTPRQNSLNINPQRNKNCIPRRVIAVYDDYEEEFPSICSAAKYFGINNASVVRAADCVVLSTYSKNLKCRVSFAWG
jgi:hypothetical protein